VRTALFCSFVRIVTKQKQKQKKIGSGENIGTIGRGRMWKTATVKLLSQMP